ncbi:MAG: flagellar hook-basal body complex protein FliE [Hyphomicrobium sp.]|jgi:flagellar hook-basal body complex protein FliE
MLEQLIPALSGVAKSSPVQGDTTIRPSATVTEPGADFGSMLARMAGDTVDTLKGAEAVSVAGIRDKASVQQVVESVMAAEQSLQTAIAVRDKVVSAYMEISRMAI